MEPVLSSGDRILIDVSLTVPVPPGIFVIWDGMGLVAKRIEHVPHSEPPRVVLKSLNPEYDSYERLAEEIRVVGRAVWVSRKL
jgi:phage repressor protein C with HTH and peptisase S24 domain